jgi:hypothetical protein
MGIVADAVELAHEMESTEADKIATLVATSIGENLVNKTYLSGLSQFAAATHNPEQFRAQYLRSLAGSLIPSGVAQTAQIADPILRDARSMLDQIKSRIPGLSESLPAKQTIFGDPITREGSLGPDIASPIFVSTEKHDPVYSELVRLNMSVSKPDRQIQGVPLDPTQHAEFVRTAGQPPRRRLRRCCRTRTTRTRPT